MSTPTSTIDTFLLKKTGTGSSATYSILYPIKDYSDLGGAPESIDVTTLSDHVRHSVPGLQDTDNVEFTSNYDKADFQAGKELEGSEGTYAVAFGMASETSVGTEGVFEFSGYLTVTISGGGVNDAREMVTTINLTSDITPSYTAVTITQ